MLLCSLPCDISLFLFFLVWLAVFCKGEREGGRKVCYGCIGCVVFKLLAVAFHMFWFWYCYPLCQLAASPRMRERALTLVILNEQRFDVACFQAQVTYTHTHAHTYREWGTHLCRGLAMKAFIFLRLFTKQTNAETIQVASGKEGKGGRGRKVV